MNSNNQINIAYSIENIEYNYNFNIVKTDKTIPLGDIQVPICNSTETPLFHVYHVLVDGLKYTKVQDHNMYKSYEREQKNDKDGIQVNENGDLLLFDTKKVLSRTDKTFKIYPLIINGQQQALKTSIFLTENGLLHYIRKSNMPEAEKISRDIENFIIDIRKGDLQISAANQNAQTIKSVYNNEISGAMQYIFQQQPTLQQISSFEDFKTSICDLLSPTDQIFKIEQRLQQIEDLFDINPLLMKQNKSLYNLKEQIQKQINDQIIKQSQELVQRLQESEEQIQEAKQLVEQLQQQVSHERQQKEEKAKQLEQTLKNIKKVHGDVYKLRIKQSVLSKIKPEFKEFVQYLIKYLTYIGMADRKHKEPFLQRFMEHIQEFKECESTDVNKALIMCSAKLLINQMLLDGQEQLEYEEIIESIRLNTEIIKDENLLRQCEAQQIQKENPFLNSIKYKNYQTEEQKEMSKLDKQLNKLQTDLQKEQLYNKALEIREIELQNKQTFTIQHIQDHYAPDLSEEYMNIVRIKNKKLETAQNNRKRSQDKYEETKVRIQTTSQKRLEFSQTKQQKEENVQRIMQQVSTTTNQRDLCIDLEQERIIIEQDQDQMPCEEQPIHPKRSKTITNKEKYPITLQNMNPNRKKKQDIVVDRELYCCGKQFKGNTWFQKHQNEKHIIQ